MQHAAMQHAYTRRCNAQRAPMHYATCNTHRCNVHEHRCSMHRGNMQHAMRTDATWNVNRCNTHRCDMLMQHTRRCIAPMQRETDNRYNTQTHGELTCTSHTARRIVYRMHLGGTRPLRGFGTWYASMHASFRWETLATRCMTSAIASCSARRARVAVQHSASRWIRPFGNDSKCVLTRSTPAACAAPCAPSIGRAAARNIPYHDAGMRNSRWAHAPPRCSRSSRP